MFPEDADDANALIRHSDAALYVAKSRGRNRFARFEASFEAKADHERQLEEGLRTALENNELTLECHGWGNDVPKNYRDGHVTLRRAV